MSFSAYMDTSVQLEKLGILEKLICQYALTEWPKVIGLFNIMDVSVCSQKE